MTSSEVEINNKVVGLKADIFDTIRQIEYLSNLKNQKIQELNSLENEIRQANIEKEKVKEKAFVAEKVTEIAK